MKRAKLLSLRDKIIFSGGLPLIVFVLYAFESEFPWWQDALVSLAMVPLLWLLFVGPTRQPKPIEEAPPHEHRFKLHFTGNIEGIRITCAHCHQYWQLNGDDSFFIQLGIFALAFFLMFLSIWVPFLRLPEPWDRLKLMCYLAVSQYVIHGIAWFFLRRKDPEKLIAFEDEGEGPKLHVPEDSKE